MDDETTTQPEPELEPAVTPAEEPAEDDEAGTAQTVDDE